MGRDFIEGESFVKRFKTKFRIGAVVCGIDLFCSPLGAKNLHGACVLLPAFSRASVCGIREMHILAALSKVGRLGVERGISYGRRGRVSRHGCLSYEA